MQKHTFKIITFGLILIATLAATAACSLPLPAEEEEQSATYTESEEKAEEEASYLQIEEGYQSPPGPANQVNILLLGLDERGLSDAIVLVSYNNETFDSAIISLKRDTYVDFQTWSEEGMGHSAIGWASYVGTTYAEDDPLYGAAFSAYNIEQLLGIRIDHYAAITFEGFVELIDQIGGVTVNVAPGFAETPLTPGWQHLDGEEALRYARHRKYPRIPEPGSISSDGDRIRRNQNLLRAVLEQCETLTTDELLDVYDKLNEKLYTNMDDWDLLILANIFFNQDLRLIEQTVLPGNLETVYEDKIDTELDYYFLDFEECDRMLTEIGVK